MPIIEANNVGGSHRTGELPETLTVEDITRVLGFGPNRQGDAWKTTAEWSFTVNGHQCGIWDYKGSRWSVYDPDNQLPKLFKL